MMNSSCTLAMGDPISDQCPLDSDELADFHAHLE